MRTTVGAVLVGASALVAAQAGATPGQGTVQIVSGGKARAVVVLAEKPTCPAQVAAREFVHYVKKMTGVALPTVTDGAVPDRTQSPCRVLIGQSKRTREYDLKNADFAVQEYLIQTRGRDLIVMGRDAEEYGPITYEKDGLWRGAWRRPGLLRHPCFVPMGSLYAVDTLLEKHAGVRWYLPGEIGEVCPKRTEWVLTNINTRTKPWTRYRWSSRQNYRVPSYFYGSREPDKLVHVPRRDMVLYMLRLKMGGSPYACNHSFNSYYGRFGKTHPEWWKGVKPTPQWPHPDYINPDLIKQAAQDAVDYFSGKFPRGRYPGGGRVMAAGDYFAVMPLDGRRGLIWSPAAEKLRNRDPAVQRGFSCGWASDYVFTVVNRVAKIVGKRFPDKWITCTAYAPYFLVPANVKTMEPNVVVQQAGVLHKAHEPEVWRLYADNLKAWSGRVKQLYVWEWYLDQAFRKFHAFPVIFPHQVARAMKHMKRCGVKGMFFEASAAPAKTGRYSDATLANPAEDLLNHYVTWKYLCDQSQDIDALLDEHYRLFYGPAAETMKAFFARIESAWTPPKGGWPTGRGLLPRYWELMCPPKRLGAYRELIHKALREATAEPYASRVRLMHQAVYKRMEKNCLAHAARFRARPRVACPLVAEAPTIDGKLDDAAWKSAGRTSALSRLTVEKRTIDTVGYVARDDKMLYVAVDCPEPHMDRLAVTERKPGAAEIDTDDHVEVLVDAGRTRVKHVHLVVNAAGAVRDSAWDEKGKKAVRGWRTGATVKTWRGPDRWTVEAAIPLAAVGATPKPGDVWGLNLGRLRRAGVADPVGHTTWWSQTDTGAKMPDDFGVLVMVGASSEVKSVCPSGGAPVPVVELTFEQPITGRSQKLATGKGLAIGGRRVVAEAGTRSLGKGKPWDAACRVRGRSGHAYAFQTEAKRYIYVTLPGELGLDRDDFTAMLWYRTTNAGGQTLLFSTTSSPLWGMSLCERKGKRLVQFLIGAPAPSAGLLADAPPADGTWHHVAVSVDRGAAARIYVDGQLQRSVDIRRYPDPLKNLVTVGGPYHIFDGTIDTVQIYKGALERKQVRAIYGTQCQGAR